MKIPCPHFQANYLTMRFPQNLFENIVNSSSQQTPNAFRPDCLRHGNNNEEQQLSTIQEQQITDNNTETTFHPTPIPTPQVTTPVQEPQSEPNFNNVQQTPLTSVPESPIANNSSTDTNNYNITPDQSTTSSNHINQMSPNTAELMTQISHLTKLLQLERDNNAMACDTIDHKRRESTKQLKAVKQQLAASQQEQAQLRVTVQQLQSVKATQVQQAPTPSTVTSTSAVQPSQATTYQTPVTVNQAQRMPQPPPPSQPQKHQQAKSKVPPPPPPSHPPSTNHQQPPSQRTTTHHHQRQKSSTSPNNTTNDILLQMLQQNQDMFCTHLLQSQSMMQNVTDSINALHSATEKSALAAEQQVSDS